MNNKNNEIMQILENKLLLLQSKSRLWERIFWNPLIVIINRKKHINKSILEIDNKLNDYLKKLNANEKTKELDELLKAYDEKFQIQLTDYKNFKKRYLLIYCSRIFVAVIVVIIIIVIAVVLANK